MSKFDFAIEASDVRNLVLLDKYKSQLEELYDKIDREIFILAHQGKSVYEINVNNFHDLFYTSMRTLFINRYQGMGYLVDDERHTIYISW